MCISWIRWLRLIELGWEPLMVCCWVLKLLYHWHGLVIFGFCRFSLAALHCASGTSSSADSQATSIPGSLVSQLKLAMAGLEARDTDMLIAKLASRSDLVWSAILELVKSISEAVSTSLPSFWRVGKGFLEGRFKKVCLFSLSFSYLHVTWRLIFLTIIRWKNAHFSVPYSHCSP